MEATLDRAAGLRPVHAPSLFAAYSRIAQRKISACAGIFLLTVALRFALLPRLPVPNPIIHDEFSYLLAADTYAHGRVTNPPHPLWQHFETMEELSQPTYASKYQPLPGLTMALGQKLFHWPWTGVVLTSALMCAAVCWMLQGWIEPEWALLGALLFTVRIGVLSYWMNSFEGGSIPALGGALAMGAISRIWRDHAHNHALTWGLGIALLMLSRPYDALLFALVTSITLLVLLRKSLSTSPRILLRLALPAVAILGLAGAVIAYVDLRVTGHALTLPYQVYDREYIQAPPFLFMTAKPELSYRHPVIHEFFAVDQMNLWRDTHVNPPLQYLGRLGTVEGFFFGWPLLMTPLLLWPYALTSTEERVGASLTGVAAVSLLPLVVGMPHYVAPFACIFYLRFLQSLRRLAQARKFAGRILAVATTALLLFSGRDYLSTGLAERSAHFGEDRAAMARRLDALPGKQLVLVRYAPGHNTQNEWVFNPADIDAARVVWAREMGPPQDRELIDYYSDRQLWLLEADRTPPALEPYPSVDRKASR